MLSDRSASVGPAAPTHIGASEPANPRFRGLSRPPNDSRPLSVCASRGFAVVPEDRSHTAADVVRVDRIAKTVAVPEAGAPLKQEHHDRGVLPPVRGRKERRPAVAISCREVRATVEQGLHRVDVAIARPSAAVSSRDATRPGAARNAHQSSGIGRRFDRAPPTARASTPAPRHAAGPRAAGDRAAGVVRRCQQEGRFTELVLDLQHRAGIQEEGDRVGLIPLNRPVKRGRPVIVAGEAIRPGSRTSASHPGEVAEARGRKRCAAPRGG